MGSSEKVTGKDATIRVNFVDVATGQSIGFAELTPEQLPAAFDVPTTFTIHEVEWQVQQAIPATAAEFTGTRQLTLQLAKIEYLNPQDINYTLPTISEELPELADAALFQEFALSLFGDDWRQNEFLPATARLRISQEADAIGEVWANHSFASSGGFREFRHVHVRQTIGDPGLALNFAQLQAVLGAPRRGSVQFHDQPGYVRHGFALQTAAATYYGLLQEGVVTHFCLDSVSKEAWPEVLAVNQAFDLVFVVWYHAQVIGPEGELPE